MPMPIPTPKFDIEMIDGELILGSKAREWKTLKMDRTWLIPGHVGFDLEVRRTGLTLYVTSVPERPSVLGLKSVEKLIEALKKAAEEIRTLGLYVTGFPAVVLCTTCSCEVFISSYKKKPYYCGGSDRGCLSD